MSSVPRMSASMMAANKALNESIAQAIDEANFGRMLAAESIITVALDQDGRIVEYRPDGTTSALPI